MVKQKESTNQGSFPNILTSAKASKDVPLKTSFTFDTVKSSPFMSTVPETVSTATSFFPKTTIISDCFKSNENISSKLLTTSTSTPLSFTSPGFSFGASLGQKKESDGLLLLPLDSKFSSTTGTQAVTTSTSIAEISHVTSESSVFGEHGISSTPKSGTFMNFSSGMKTSQTSIFPVSLFPSPANKNSINLNSEKIAPDSQVKSSVGFNFQKPLVSTNQPTMSSFNKDETSVAPNISVTTSISSSIVGNETPNVTIIPSDNPPSTDSKIPSSTQIFNIQTAEEQKLEEQNKTVSDSNLNQLTITLVQKSEDSETTSTVTNATPTFTNLPALKETITTTATSISAPKPSVITSAISPVLVVDAGIDSTSQITSSSTVTSTSIADFPQPVINTESAVSQSEVSKPSSPASIFFSQASTSTPTSSVFGQTIVSTAASTEAANTVVTSSTTDSPVVSTFGLTSNLFGQTKPETSSFFGNATPDTSVFGQTPVTQTAVFGQTPATQSSTFEQTSTTQSSAFGQKPATQAPTFGQTPVTQTPAFGQTPVTQAPAFGQTPTTQNTAFGQTPTTQSTVFGQAPTTQTAAFSQTSTTQSSVFGQTPATQANAFGQPATNQTFGSSSGGFFSQAPGFGASTATSNSDFNNQSSAFSFGKPAFGPNAAG